MGSLSSEQKMEKVEYKDLDKMDKWILSRLSYMVDTVNANIQKYDFHVATSALKNYLYYEFCDTYLVRLFIFVSLLLVCSHLQFMTYIIFFFIAKILL